MILGPPNYLNQINQIRKSAFGYFISSSPNIEIDDLVKRTPKNHRDPSDQFFSNSNMESIASKSHDMDILMFPILLNEFLFQKTIRKLYCKLFQKISKNTSYLGIATNPRKPFKNNENTKKHLISLPYFGLY